MSEDVRKAFGLDEKMCLVFGSNLAGKHGAGSAHTALKFYGARYGIGVGHVGNSYAIPTKDERIETMPLEDIKPYVDDFIQYAKDHPEIEFQIVSIGCGLAGYTFSDMAPLFIGAPSNCHFINNWNEV